MEIGIGLSASHLTVMLGRPRAILDYIPGAVAAWSAARRLRSNYGGSIATINTGVFATIFDQVGARNLTAVGSPAQGVGTINGNAYVKMDGVDDLFSFPSLALAASDWTIFVAMGIDASNVNTGAIIGRVGGTTGIRGTATNNFDFRSDTVGPQAYSTVWQTTPGFHVYRFERTGGNVYISTDGEQIGSPFGRGLAGNFTFDRVGVSGAATAFSKMGLGEIIIFPRILSAFEIAAVEADMIANWTPALYIDDTGGSDANLGWNAQTAFQTCGKVRPMIVRKNQRIRLKRGGAWRRDPMLWNVLNQSGAAGAPVVIESYGAGSVRPILDGSKLVAGPWTLVSGTEYKATIALTSVQCAWVTAASVITRLTLGTVGALTNGQYAYNGGDTTLHINVGADPTGSTVSAADLDAGTIPDDNGVRAAKPFIAVRGIEVKHWPTDGYKFEGDNCSYTDFYTHHNANDGVGGSGLSVYLGQGQTEANGQGRSISGAPGDGASLHGVSTGVIEDVIALNNDKAGFDHQETATVIHRRCKSDGNNQNLLVAANAGTPGTHTFENSIFIRRPNDQARHFQAVNSANIILRNSTVVNLDVASVGSGIYQSATGSLEIKNTIVDGFNLGLESIAGTLSRANNLWNNTTNPALGATEKTGAALFVDRANANFRITSTLSPARAAGVDLGITSDYDRLTRHGPVDLGAFDIAA